MKKNITINKLKPDNTFCKDKASVLSHLCNPKNLQTPQMATTTISSSSLISPTLLQKPTKPIKTHLPILHFHPQIPHFTPLKSNSNLTRFKPLNVVAEESSVVTVDPTSVGARRLYVGNIPRTLKSDELQKIVEEHGAAEKAEVMYDKYSGRSRRFAFVTMKTVEDATAAAEKLNGTEVGGRVIKVNVTEKPLASFETSVLQTEESQFVDSPNKVYVGNLAKTVTTESLKSFFAEKGKVLSAKVSRVPGTSKSSGYGFVAFASEEDVEAAISSLNNEVLEGQKIRVNKA